MDGRRMGGWSEELRKEYYAKERKIRKEERENDKERVTIITRVELNKYDHFIGTI